MLRNERWTPSPTTNASPTDTFSGTIPYKSAFDAIEERIREKKLFKNAQLEEELVIS